MTKQNKAALSATASGMLSQNPGRLCFQSTNDALYFARRFAENGLRQSIKGGLSLSEAYAKGDVEVLLEVTTLADSQKFNLVLRSYPASGFDRDPTRYLGRVPVLDGDFISGAHADDALVFIRTRQSEDGVEARVPHFAHIQRLNECHQIGMDISAPPFDFAFEVMDGFPNWKVDASFRVLEPAMKRAVADRLIQCVLKVVNDAVSSESDRGRYWLSQTQTDDFFAALVIDFFDELVSVRIDDRLAQDFKISYPRICLTNKEL